MSIWSSLEGIIHMRKDCGCSAESLIKEVFDDYRKPVLEYDLVTNRTHIVLEYREGGQDALDTAECFISKLRNYDRHAFIDLTFSTRIG